MFCLPEVDHRQNHIDQIPTNYSLLPIALDCLKNEENEHPSAHQLCERVADLKRMPKYTDNARNIKDKDEVIQSQAIHIEENEHKISLKEAENQQLKQQLQQKRDETSRQLEERDKLNQQLIQLRQNTIKL